MAEARIPSLGSVLPRENPGSSVSMMKVLTPRWRGSALGSDWAKRTMYLAAGPLLNWASQAVLALF